MTVTERWGQECHVVDKFRTYYISSLPMLIINRGSTSFEEKHLKSHILSEEHYDNKSKVLMVANVANVVNYNYQEARYLAVVPIRCIDVFHTLQVPLPNNSVMDPFFHQRNRTIITIQWEKSEYNIYSQGIFCAFRSTVVADQHGLFLTVTVASDKILCNFLGNFWQ